MKAERLLRSLSAALLLAACGLTAVGCSTEPVAPPTKAEVSEDPAVFRVDHPELFKLVKAETRQIPTVLTANGAIVPDITRTIHVTSLGSGRVVGLKVRLGDSVKKGQTLLIISSPDLSQAVGDWQKARADEQLAGKSLERAQLLYSHGALAEKDLQVAQSTEDKTKVDVQTAESRVRVLGGDPAHPAQMIELRAPVSGTIIEQNVAGFEGIKSLDNTPNLFTIADLSSVWVVCDVFENDLGEVHNGDAAEIRLNAYPERVFHGTIADISRVLDPNTRSAKVRIVLSNREGVLRPGMFAMATFRSRKLQARTVIPTTAVMRLQDKDWVFVKEGDKQFRKLEVRPLGSGSDGMQQIQGGLKPDQEIVVNALAFSTEAAGQGK